MLVEGLPPTSALHRRATGNNWQDSTHLLAAMTDSMRELVAWSHAVNGEGHRYVAPEPVWRPKSVAQMAEERADAERLEAAKADIRRIMRIATGG